MDHRQANRWSFLVCVFLVIPLAQNKDRHIRVDIIIAAVRGKPKYIMEAFVSLLAFIVFAVLVYVGSKEWLAAWEGGYISRGLIDIPNTIHLGFLVFGAFLMCVSVFITMFRNICSIFSEHKFFAREET
jgi:TRAP-type C4-dicarboxylate transport system permease small subunit